MDYEKEAREYLEQAINMDRVIENKIMMVERLRSIATKTTTYVRKDAGRGNRPQGLEETIAKIVDMEREINTDIDWLIDLKREIMDVLEQVTDTTCRVFLEKRYLENKTGYEIAEEMNYSKSWAKYCHRKGLAMVGEILLKSGKIEKHCP